MSLASAVARGLKSVMAAADPPLVTYGRGGQSVELSAVKLVVNLTQERGDGTTVELQRIDWLIEAVKIVLGGQVVLPAAGDTIKYAEGGTNYTYEAMPIGTDSHYRPADPAGRYLRVHTKLVPN